MQGHTHRTRFISHGSTVIDVVYTNEEDTVLEVLNMYERWIEEDEHKFIGLNLEYTKEDDEYHQEVVVVQLAKRNHVLVYHVSWYVDLPSLVYMLLGFFRGRRWWRFFCHHASIDTYFVSTALLLDHLMESIHMLIFLLVNFTLVPNKL